MTAEVIPLPACRPPHPGKLMALIRKLAKAGAIRFSAHAFSDRSPLRGIDMNDVKLFLQLGEMRGGVTAGHNAGEWKCKVACQPENSSRWVGIPLVVVGESHLYDLGMGGQMSKRAEFLMKGQALLAEPYHYTASGLDNVYLLNGVTIDDTPYGPMVNIQNLNGLHHAIGLHIVENEGPMTGPEFRFLRKQLELTQAELAHAMRISDQTIANYEKGVTEPGPADPYIRFLYLLEIVPAETKVELLKIYAERKRSTEGAALPDIPRRKLVQKWQEKKVA